MCGRVARRVVALLRNVSITIHSALLMSRQSRPLHELYNVITIRRLYLWQLHLERHRDWYDEPVGRSSAVPESLVVAAAGIRLDTGAVAGSHHHHPQLSGNNRSRTWSR